MAEADEKLQVGDIVELVNTSDPSKPGPRASIKKMVSTNLWAVLPEGEEKTRIVASRNLRRLEEQVAVASEPKAPCYCIVGTWDDWEAHSMIWDAGTRSFKFNVQISDSQGNERFLLLLEGEWGRCVHPDRQDATPHDGHNIVGPDSCDQGECWAITAKTGAMIQIGLEVDGDGNATRVTWSSVNQLADDSHPQAIHRSNGSNAPEDRGLLAAPSAPAGEAEGMSEEEKMLHIERTARERLEKSFAAAAAIENLPIEDDQKQASVQQEDMEALLRKMRLEAAKLRWKEYEPLLTSDEALAEDTKQAADRDTSDTALTEDTKEATDEDASDTALAEAVAEDTKQATDEDLTNTAHQPVDAQLNKCQECGGPTPYMRCSKCLLLHLASISFQLQQRQKAWNQEPERANPLASAQDLFDRNHVI